MFGITRSPIEFSGGSLSLESELSSAQLFVLNGTAPYYGDAIDGLEVLRDANGNYDYPVTVYTPHAQYNQSTYLSLGDNDHFSGEIDFSAWIKVANWGLMIGPIFSKYAGGGLEYSFGIYAGTAYAIVYDVANTAALVRKTPDLSSLNGLWVHYRVTYTVADGIKIFIDGVRTDNADENSGTFVSCQPGTQPLQIGGTDGGLGGSLPLNGIADVRLLNIGTGITRYIPLQEGIGSYSTNDQSYWYDSEGNYGSATWSGTPSNIWPDSRVDGKCQDHCINYGGRFGATHGEFIGGVPDDTVCMDGNAPALEAGRSANIYSRLNLNPNGDYVGRMVSEDVWLGKSIENVHPEASAWKRSTTDGDDRIAVFAAGLTGSVLAQAKTYFSTPTSAIDQIIDNYINSIYRYGGVLDAGNTTRITTLLADLRDADLLRQIQALWLFQGNRLNSARLNAVNPTTINCSGLITWTGSPALNTDGGFTPAVGVYGMTDLHADGIGLTALSGAGLGFYGTSNAGAGEYTLGNYDQFHLSPRVTTNGYVRISGADIDAGAAQDLTGFHYAAREPNGTTVKAYRNATRYANASVAFSGTFMPTSTAKFKIGGVIEGGAHYPSTLPLRLAMVTHGILEADVATLNSIIQEYVA